MHLFSHRHTWDVKARGGILQLDSCRGGDEDVLTQLGLQTTYTEYSTAVIILDPIIAISTTTLGNTMERASIEMVYWKSSGCCYRAVLRKGKAQDKELHLV